MPGRIQPRDLTVRVAHILSTEGRRGVSNAAIARALGISPHQVGRYMNGQKAPNLEEFAAICDILGLDWMDVLQRAAPATTGHPDQDDKLNTLSEPMRPE